MHRHEKIDYVEFAAKDLEATKTFFGTVFGWGFTDYGPEYTAFANAGLDGGFFQADLQSSPANGGALIIFYSADLEARETDLFLSGRSPLPLYRTQRQRICRLVGSGQGIISSSPRGARDKRPVRQSKP